MSVTRFFEKVATFTCILPDSFTGYRTTQEEENNNSIELRTPVQLFEHRIKRADVRDSSSALLRIDQDFVIPTGTYGRIISESNPKVAYWFHNYSGLKYLGKLLETFLAAGDQIDGITGGSADRDSVADIIGNLQAFYLEFQSQQMSFLIQETRDQLEWRPT